jgi:hypothetical protein
MNACLRLFAIPLLVTGCATEIAGVVIPELDASGIDCTGRSLTGKSVAQIVAALGESPYGLSNFFPIRVAPYRNGRCVPAPGLRISFDERGIVKEKQFFNPQTQHHMPMSETIEEADQRRLSSCRPLPRVALADIKVGQSTKADIEALVRPLEPALRKFGHPTFEAMMPNRDVWVFYVDRPSPLFIPSSWFGCMWQEGVATSCAASGYAGCI